MFLVVENQKVISWECNRAALVLVTNHKKDGHILYMRGCHLILYAPTCYEIWIWINYDLLPFL